MCAAAQRARQMDACVGLHRTDAQPIGRTRRRGGGRDADTTAAVQELHLVALHVLCDGLEAALREAP